jgi:hypothetical protein
MGIDLNKRYQTMIVLWSGLLMSVVFYFLISVFVTPNVGNEPDNSRRVALIFTLTGLGTVLVILSFAAKNKLLERSVENQDLGLVQKALILACAMCEAGALLGLVEFFVLGNRESYLLFALAAIGIVVHFPRRNQLEAASYKNNNLLR